MAIKASVCIPNEDKLTRLQNINKYFIGLGGTFLLKEGRAKEHIMPDFSKTPLNSDGDVNEWLHFFDMSAPLINVGTLLSHDPVN